MQEIFRKEWGTFGLCYYSGFFLPLTPDQVHNGGAVIVLGVDLQLELLLGRQGLEPLLGVIVRLKQSRVSAGESSDSDLKGVHHNVLLVLGVGFHPQLVVDGVPAPSEQVRLDFDERSHQAATLAVHPVDNGIFAGTGRTNGLEHIHRHLGPHSPRGQYKLHSNIVHTITSSARRRAKIIIGYC